MSVGEIASHGTPSHFVTSELSEGKFYLLHIRRV